MIDSSGLAKDECPRRLHQRSASASDKLYKTLTISNAKTTRAADGRPDMCRKQTHRVQSTDPTRPDRPSYISNMFPNLVRSSKIS